MFLRPFFWIKMKLLGESDASIFQHLHGHLWCQVSILHSAIHREKVCFFAIPHPMNTIQIRSWSVELQRSRIYQIYVCQPTISTCREASQLIKRTNARCFSSFHMKSLPSPLLGEYNQARNLCVGEKLFLQGSLHVSNFYAACSAWTSLEF